MSTLEERALADSDDSDRFVTSNHDYPAAIASFVDQTKALVKAQQERDEALAALGLIAKTCDTLLFALNKGALTSGDEFLRSDFSYLKRLAELDPMASGPTP